MRDVLPSSPALPSSDAELLALYVAALDELRARGITRSDNVPTGDYAERIVAAHFNVPLEPNSAKGYDLVVEGQRLQVNHGVSTSRGAKGVSEFCGTSPTANTRTVSSTSWSPWSSSATTRSATPGGCRGRRSRGARASRNDGAKPASPESPARSWTRTVSVRWSSTRPRGDPRLVPDCDSERVPRTRSQRLLASLCPSSAAARVIRATAGPLASV